MRRRRCHGSQKKGPESTTQKADVKVKSRYLGEEKKKTRIQKSK